MGQTHGFERPGLSPVWNIFFLLFLDLLDYKKDYKKRTCSRLIGSKKQIDYEEIVEGIKYKQQ